MNDINVGERVHATSTVTRDEVTFTVMAEDSDWVTGYGIRISRADFIFEVIVPPLPTKVGATIRRVVSDGIFAHRTQDGRWIDDDGTDIDPDPSEWDVVFEGCRS